MDNGYTTTIDATDASWTFPRLIKTEGMVFFSKPSGVKTRTYPQKKRRRNEKEIDKRGRLVAYGLKKH